MLVKDHGLVPVEQDAVLDVPADSAGEDHLFQVAAFLQQVVEGIAVGDAHDILLNDGTVIEDFGDVMAGGADELYADRKSTRLNSSHVAISYAVFCLKKKNRH